MMETLGTVTDDEINIAGLNEAEADLVRRDVLDHSDEADMEIPVDAENCLYVRHLVQQAIEALNLE